MARSQHKWHSSARLDTDLVVGHQFDELGSGLREEELRCQLQGVERAGLPLEQLAEQLHVAAVRVELALKSRGARVRGAHELRPARVDGGEPVADRVCRIGRHRERRARGGGRSAGRVWPRPQSERTHVLALAATVRRVTMREHLLSEALHVLHVRVLRLEKLSLHTLLFTDLLLQ